MKCGYCKEMNKEGGWHNCPSAVRSRRRLANVLIGIDELMRGGIEPVDPQDRTAVRQQKEFITTVLPKHRKDIYRAS